MVQTCGHVFGAQCLVQWVDSGNANQHQCPICRGSLSGRNAIIAEDGSLFNLNLPDVPMEEVNNSIGPVFAAPPNNNTPVVPASTIDLPPRQAEQNPIPAHSRHTQPLTQRLRSALSNPIASIRQNYQDIRTAVHNRPDHSASIISLLMPHRRAHSRTAARARHHNANRVRAGADQRLDNSGVHGPGLPWGVYLAARPVLVRAPAYDEGWRNARAFRGL